mmetsp:Transcript_19468/g.22390  ORF Transcript_19468/g.22390 Transcript_19468/m.22390 type:complete len:88 (-) Transcript_19468:86-349(-)
MLVVLGVQRDRRNGEIEREVVVHIGRVRGSDEHRDASEFSGVDWSLVLGWQWGFDYATVVAAPFLSKEEECRGEYGYGSVCKPGEFW